MSLVNYMLRRHGRNPLAVRLAAALLLLLLPCASVALAHAGHHE